MDGYVCLLKGGLEYLLTAIYVTCRIYNILSFSRKESTRG